MGQLELDPTGYIKVELAELEAEASRTVHAEGDELVFDHLYAERRIRPLDPLRLRGRVRRRRVGTAGSLRGIGTRLRAHDETVHMVAVEPEDSPVISQTKAGGELKPGPHKIQGIGAGFVPEILNTDIVDEIIQIENDEAFKMARRLAHNARGRVGGKEPENALIQPNQQDGMAGPGGRNRQGLHILTGVGVNQRPIVSTIR